MVWFWFQWFTKPTLTQHPRGESDLTKHTHTHTHFPQHCKWHHTHTSILYILHEQHSSLWSRCSFLTQSNQTKHHILCTPDIQPLMIEYHFKRNSSQRNEHSVIILFHSPMISFLDRTIFRSMSKLLFSKILYATLFHDNNIIFAKKYFCLTFVCPDIILGFLFISI